MKLFPAALLVLSLALSGCNLVPNRYSPDKIADGRPVAGSGIAILSTGAPERCISTATFLKVLPADAKYFSRELALLNVDGYATPSDFTTHHGNIHAVVLPAGDYYLAEWIANPYISPVKVSRADFSIKAGEVVYLGEFFKPVSCVLNPVSRFADRQERDVELLLKKNPHFDRSSIEKRIPRYSGYAVDAKR